MACGKLLAQIFSVAGQRRFVVAIHPAFEPHFAEHHLRAGGKVFVDGNGFAERVGDFRDGLPRGSLRQFAGQPFAQDHDVGGDLGVGVFLEGVVRQPDGTDQIRLMRDIFPQRAVELVQRALRRDEQNQSAGPDLVERLGEEIIVDDEVPVFELRVERLVIAERNVGNGHVVKSVRQF